MSDTFDRVDAQQRAFELRAQMCNGTYRHYNTGSLYFVTDVVVDKETGESRVSYVDKTTGWSWSQSASDFTVIVEAGDGSMVPRFTLVRE